MPGREYKKVLDLADVLLHREPVDDLTAVRAACVVTGRNLKDLP